jgi:hypothetical protein
MPRYLTCVIVFFALTLGIAHAVPVRPLYEPAFPVAPPSTIVNLNGTSWLGKYQTINRIFIFEPDGSLSYRTTIGKAGGKIYKNRGVWKLEGNVLTFDYFTTPANKLMEFRGTVIDADTIVGEATYRLNIPKAQQTLKRTTVDPK